MPFPTATITQGSGLTINTLPNAGQTTMANSLGVVIASDQSAIPTVAVGAQVTVTPTVTVGAYSSGYVIGGIMTFANALPSNFTGMIQSLTLRFAYTAQTIPFDFAIFNASPAGTFSNQAAPVISVADTAKLIGVYSLLNSVNSLGTHAIYNLDGVAKQIAGVSTSLFGVIVARGAPINPGNAADMSATIGVLW